MRLPWLSKRSTLTQDKHPGYRFMPKTKNFPEESTQKPAIAGQNGPWQG
jgi:hypothetical protein